MLDKFEFRSSLDCHLFEVKTVTQSLSTVSAGSLLVKKSDTQNRIIIQSLEYVLVIYQQISKVVLLSIVRYNNHNFDLNSSLYA